MRFLVHFFSLVRVLTWHCQRLVWITLVFSLVLPQVLGLDAWVFSLHLQHHLNLLFTKLNNLAFTFHFSYIFSVRGLWKIFTEKRRFNPPQWKPEFLLNGGSIKFLRGLPCTRESNFGFNRESLTSNIPFAWFLVLGRNRQERGQPTNSLDF